MNDIFTAPFLTEMRQTAANMYRLGWDERNGGNISLLLDEAEVQKYLDTTHILRTLPLGFDAAALVGNIFWSPAPASILRMWTATRRQIWALSVFLMTGRTQSCSGAIKTEAGLPRNFLRI